MALVMVLALAQALAQEVALAQQERQLQVPQAASLTHTAFASPARPAQIQAHLDMAMQPVAEVALLTCMASAALVWPAVEVAANPEVLVANQEALVAIEVLAAKRLKVLAASTEVLAVLDIVCPGSHVTELLSRN